MSEYQLNSLEFLIAMGLACVVPRMWQKVCFGAYGFLCLLGMYVANVRLSN